MKETFSSEQELAAKVAEWLSCDGWEVYEEVMTGYGIADLVGKRGKITHVVECKRSAGLSVMLQAHEQQSSAEYVSVAVPLPTKGICNSQFNFFLRLCEREGIGVFTVNPSRWHDEPVLMVLAPSYKRRERLINNAIRGSVYWDIPLRDRLQEEQIYSGLAGSSKGGYWTPFKATCSAVLRFVSENPGCTARDCIAGIEHHWANKSAPYTLTAFVGKGLVPGVEFQTVNGKRCLFLTSPTQ